MVGFLWLVGWFWGGVVFVCFLFCCGLFYFFLFVCILVLVGFVGFFGGGGIESTLTCNLLIL